MSVPRDLSPNLRLEFSRSTQTLKLIGELDMSNAGRLRDALREHLSPGGIALDLSELGFMDSAGLQVILGQAMALESGEIRVNAPSPMVRKLFRMTGVDRLPALVIETVEAEGPRTMQAADESYPLGEESA